MYAGESNKNQFLQDYSYIDKINPNSKKMMTYINIVLNILQLIYHCVLIFMTAHIKWLDQADFKIIRNKVNMASKITGLSSYFNNNSGLLLYCNE